jgi:hypothetical protein
MKTGQISDVHYKINWLGGFEINPRDQAAAELDRIRALQIMADWMIVNEIREVEGLERVCSSMAFRIKSLMAGLIPSG